MGKFGYQSKDVRVKPIEVLNGNDRLLIDNDGYEIRIVANEEQIDGVQDNLLEELEESILNLSFSPPAKKVKCYSEDDNAREDIIREEDKILQDCIPGVREEMKKSGNLDTWIRFNKMLASKEFPLYNIAFLLFMDVCKFLSLENTSSMRYSDKVKEFWRIGFKLFHGKWLRFMGGPKHRGQLVLGQSSKGIYKPSESLINFAIPHRAVLSSDLSPLSPENVSPGILETLLSRFAQKAQTEPHKTYKICIDGKKINAAITSKEGDINLWGFEDKPTLEERQSELSNEIEAMEYCKQEVMKLQQMHTSCFNDLRDDEQTTLSEMLRRLITSLSKRLRTLRETVLHEERTKDRLINSIDGDWRKSKLVFVISGLLTHLFDLKSCIRTILRDIDDLCRYVVISQNTKWTCNGVFNMKPSREHITEDINISDTENYRYVAQRSSAWFAIRKIAKVTGSTIYNALGLGKFKFQLEHFDNVTFNKPKTEHSSEVNLRLQHGTENEVNASATFAANILPVFHKDLSFFEEGCYKI